jgi:hypothetical protein
VPAYSRLVVWIDTQVIRDEPHDRLAYLALSGERARRRRSGSGVVGAV